MNLATVRRSISEVLVERKWSQRVLSEETGIHEASISRFLRGHQDIDLGAFLTIVSALGVPPERLLDGSAVASIRSNQVTTRLNRWTDAEQFAILGVLDQLAELRDATLDNALATVRGRT